MSDKIKIYLASPLGFSEVGRSFMYEKIIPIIEEWGYSIIDPWKLTPNNLIQSVFDLPYGEERKASFKKLNKIMAEKNTRAIKDSSGLVAILDGVDVDSGTASEIGYASALKKPILGYRGDFRLASDNEGSIVNLQVEHFIYSSGGKIITEIKDLGKELKVIFG